MKNWKIKGHLISSIRPILEYRFPNFKVIQQCQTKLKEMEGRDCLWEIDVEVMGDIDEFESILRDNYETIKFSKEAIT